MPGGAFKRIGIGKRWRNASPRTRDRLTFLVIALLVLTIPAYISSEYYLSVLAFLATRFMMVLGLALLLGQAGQISLGQAGFVAIGAYGAGILTTKAGLNPWLSMVIAALVAGAVAALVGRPTLRLRGYYLAMATLGVNEIIYILIVQLKSLTNGTDGIAGIPSLSLGSLDLGQPRLYHVLVWAMALVMLRFSLNLTRSRPGRALRALKESEIAAEAHGVDVASYKLKIFVIAAVLGSIAGSLDAFYVHYISPESYGVSFSIILITGVVLGGLKSVWGALWGSLLIVILPEIIGRFNDDATHLVFGALLVLVMLVWKYRGKGKAKAS